MIEEKIEQLIAAIEANTAAILATGNAALEEDALPPPKKKRRSRKRIEDTPPPPPVSSPAPMTPDPAQAPAQAPAPAPAATLPPLTSPGQAPTFEEVQAFAIEVSRLLGERATELSTRMAMYQTGTGNPVTRISDLRPEDFSSFMSDLEYYKWTVEQA